ncbi:early nodulin-20-like [Dioscorea cayenensis subsp. rotundata]|uniref:Early nodulin-20-like n=1 Tax=Dioscorea cayennensis subsp. rotundata TaxID=55577 RepID=A0AB40AQR7_DIOCR|nr:early nodulin-20-like [Dioscorea cayenensis subsp. rotundata]
MDSLKSSSARKLPIKRRPPPLSSSSPPSPSPSPDPSSTLPYSDDAADDDPSSDSLHPPPFKFQQHPGPSPMRSASSKAFSGATLDPMVFPATSISSLIASRAHGSTFHSLSTFREAPTSSHQVPHHVRSYPPWPGPLPSCPPC